jgi:hypothetical protein
MDSQVMTPSIAELTAGYLARSTAAPALGAEVEAYDVATAFRTEPRLAWTETTAVLKQLGETTPTKMPGEFAAAVRTATPATLIPMAFGTYPQMVSDLAALLKTPRVRTAVTLAAIEGNNTSPAVINQEAAIAWLAGDDAKAVKLWNSLPEGAVKAFNLGVAALATGSHSIAVTQLKAASRMLSESSGWKSLAELYGALAASEA